MSKFKSREEFNEWVQYQFRKYGIRQPDTYNTKEQDKVVE